jgi:hypothetical protein
MADPAWAPTPGEVAGLLAQRTLTADGEQVGTFDQFTIPNAQQVAALVSLVCSDILAACGAIPAPTGDGVDLEADAKGVATVGAAALVERSFFATDPDSVYRDLHAQFEAMLARLVTACGQVDNGGPVSPAGALPSPRWAFPDTRPAPVVEDGVPVTSLTEHW